MGPGDPTSHRSKNQQFLVKPPPQRIAVNMFGNDTALLCPTS